MRCRYCKGRIAPSTGHAPRLLSQSGFESTWECDIKGVALVPVTVCAECGGSLRCGGAAQLPLFRHGGYGGVTETSALSCEACGWTKAGVVATLNPRRFA